MSWDVLVLSCADQPSSLEEVEQTDTMGSVDDVRQKISDALPGTEWDEAGGGIHSAGELSIEFNLHEDGDGVSSVSLLVHGEGVPVAAILKVSEPNGWCAFDLAGNQRLTRGAPRPRGWAGYRSMMTKRDDPST